MKLRTKSFFKDYYIKLYSHHLLFSYNQTNSQFEDSLDKHFKERKLKRHEDADLEDLMRDNAEAMTHYLTHRTVCIRIFKHTNKSFNELSDSIAHEALHATREIMESIQVELNDETEEVYAYMIGYIVNNIIGDLVNDKT